MASNKDNQLVKKNEDNLEVENISSNHSIESRKKTEVFSEDDSKLMLFRDSYEKRLLYTAITRARNFLDIYFLN